MPDRLSLTSVVATLTLGVAPLAGCATFHVDAYPTEVGTQRDCDALLHDLPASVDGLDRRTVEDDVAGAWGDPAVVLRCGVPADDEMQRCVRAGALTWFRSPLADGSLYSSSGRRFTVSVEVPRGRDTAQVLDDLLPALDRHDPRTAQPCTPGETRPAD
ncbi:MAG: DUF3515 family protein [Aeromicrobium erythreum]